MAAHSVEQTPARAYRSRSSNPWHPGTLDVGTFSLDRLFHVWKLIRIAYCPRPEKVTELSSDMVEGFCAAVVLIPLATEGMSDRCQCRGVPDVPVPVAAMEQADHGRDNGVDVLAAARLPARMERRQPLVGEDPWMGIA